jgi:hypothetical protein
MSSLVTEEQEYRTLRENLDYNCSVSCCTVLCLSSKSIGL